MPTDEELIDEIKNGSQAAMEVLVKKHYKNIFAYVYRKVGDYHLAYDLTQEVFIKMMVSIPGYNAKGKFKNWLITIAVNHCRDYFGSSTYREKRKEQKLIDHVKDDRENVWDLLSKKIDSEKMKETLGRLPDYQREPIILRFYHDLTIKEIAQITESKESTVKSRLRQGISKLRNLLQGGNKDGKRQSK